MKRCTTLRYPRLPQDGRRPTTCTYMTRKGWGSTSRATRQPRIHRHRPMADPAHAERGTWNHAELASHFASAYHQPRAEKYWTMATVGSQKKMQEHVTAIPNPSPLELVCGVWFGDGGRLKARRRMPGSSTPAAPLTARIAGGRGCNRVPAALIGGPMLSPHARYPSTGHLRGTAEAWSCRLRSRTLLPPSTAAAPLSA